jgi:hypothetical protein
VNDKDYILQLSHAPGECTERPKAVGDGGDEAGLAAEAGGDEDVLRGDALVRTMAPPQLYTYGVKG